MELQNLKWIEHSRKIKSKTIYLQEDNTFLVSL
jgi:hypothetical protein